MEKTIIKKFAGECPDGYIFCEYLIAEGHPVGTVMRAVSKEERENALTDSNMIEFMMECLDIRETAYTSYDKMVDEMCEQDREDLYFQTDGMGFIDDLREKYNLTEEECYITDSCACGRLDDLYEYFDNEFRNEYDVVLVVK